MFIFCWRTSVYSLLKTLTKQAVTSQLQLRLYFVRSYITINAYSIVVNIIITSAIECWPVPFCRKSRESDV